MKKTILAIVLVAGLTSFAGISKGSTLINWASYNDFGTSGSSTGNVTSITSGTGLLKDINSGANTGVSLQVTGVTFSDNGSGPTLTGNALAYFGSAVAPGLNNNGRAFGQGVPLTFTFSGLNPDQLYDLAFFTCDSESGRTTTFVVSGINSLTAASSTGVTASTTTVSNDTASYVGNGGNPNQIVRFANISDSAGTFSVRLTTPGQEMISSMRLATGPIPEPSALSLLAIGLGGLAMMRRRRS